MSAAAAGVAAAAAPSNSRSVTRRSAPTIESPTHTSPASVSRLATMTRCSLSPSRNRIRWYAVGAMSSTAAAPVTSSVAKYSPRWNADSCGKRAASGAVRRNANSTCTPVWTTRTSCSSSTRLRSHRSSSVSVRPLYVSCNMKLRLPAAGGAEPQRLLRRQQEDLERPHGVEHDLAVVRQHLATRELRHCRHRLASHGLLERQPVAPHDLLLAVGQQRLLVAGEAALHGDEHIVVEDPGFGAGGSLAVVLLHEGDQRVRQRRAQGAVLL